MLMFIVLKNSNAKLISKSTEDTLEETTLMKEGVVDGQLKATLESIFRASTLGTAPVVIQVNL